MMRTGPGPAIMDGGADSMERGAGLHDPPDRPALLQPTHPVRRRSMEPHHRRRRAVAVLSLIGLAVLAILLLTGGGGGGRTPGSATLLRRGSSSRVDQPAGARAESPAEREAAAADAGIDRTLTYTPYVRIAGAQHREVALTFDDGPGPYTPQ